MSPQELMIFRRDFQDPKKPWTMKGYTGKLRSTVSVNLDDYAFPPPKIDDMIEIVLQLDIEDQIPYELTSALLKYYDRLKKSGKERIE